jgi:2-keto-myo-inositol isomerase
MSKLKWAFHSFTLPWDVPWAEELRLLERYDWSAAELSYDKVKARLDVGETCSQLARQLREAGVRPIGMLPGILWTDAEGRDAAEERAELQRRLDVTAELGAGALLVVPVGKVDDLPQEYAILADKLVALSDMAAARDLRLNVEFVGGWPILGTLRSCIDLLQVVNHPAAGLLFDLCNYYSGPSHLEDLVLLPPEKLFLVHVDDARKKPMEALGNEDRVFPGEGMLNVPGLLREIRRMTDYDGYFSLEILDKEIWKLPPDEVFARAEQGVRHVEERLG